MDRAVQTCMAVADRCGPGADYSLIISVVAETFGVSEVELANAWMVAEEGMAA